MMAIVPSLLQVPDMFSFREYDGGVRLYFLAAPTGRKENTLMYCDMTDDGKATPWKQLLDILEPLESAVTTLSKVVSNVASQCGYRNFRNCLDILLNKLANIYVAKQSEFLVLEVIFRSSSLSSKICYIL